MVYKGTKELKNRMVRLKESTYQKLMKIGIFGESFDDVIRRVLEIDKLQKKEAKTTVKDKEMANKL